MTNSALKALIVDDEPVICMAVSFALQQEAFDCTLADSADVAWEMACSTQFDLVITDLRMPVRHGHALATDLLALQQRPFVVIHSAIDDPRLTRDLMARGVDDIVYKPANYLALAAKLRVSVSRHRQRLLPITDEPRSEAQVSAQSGSCAAIDAFFAASNDNADPRSLLLSLMQDPAITDQLLVLANSATFNRTGHVTTDVMVALRRIGMTNLAELALQRLHVSR